MYEYGGNLMNADLYKFGGAKAAQIGGQVLSTFGSLAGNIPGIGTAVGAAAGGLGKGLTEIGNQKAAGVEKIGWGEVAKDVALGAASGATGMVGAVALGAADKALETTYDSPIEKQQKQDALELSQNPNDPTLIAEAEDRAKQAAVTGTINQGIGTVGGVVGGAMNNNSSMGNTALGNAGQGLTQIPMNSIFRYGGMANMYNKEIMNNKKYGDNMFRYGGNIYSNGGFGDNNMNEIPVTQFGNGGTHEENPLGGIPQGVGANGKQNLVEEGELKVPDPRPQSEGGFFIVSADSSMKITKSIAEQYDIPKKYVGKSVLKAAESILRKDSRREGDTIEQNSIDIELANFLDAHEELTAMKKAKEEGKFMEELAALEEKYPEYMQALMGGQEEQPMDPAMGGMGQGMEQQMSPEEQAMMEQQMMAQQQGGMPQGGMPQGAPGMEQGMDPAMMGGMPPEAMGMAYGGNMYEYGSTMDNMYGMGANMYNLGEFMSVDNLDLNSQKQLTGGVGDDIIGLSEEQKKFDNIEQLSYQKSLGTLAGQAAPIVGNLISGLLPPQEYDGSLGRMSPVELERMEAGQTPIDIRESSAGTLNALQSAGVGAGSYLGNLNTFQNSRNSALARFETDRARQNAIIANQEAQLNVGVDKNNMGNLAKEFELDEAAETAKALALREAAKQAAGWATADEQNKLGLMYANAYADNPKFNLNYQPNPFARMFKKDQQTS